jgi:hypothetical protein
MPFFKIEIKQPFETRNKFIMSVSVLQGLVINKFSGSSPGGLQPFYPSDNFFAVAKQFI